MTFFTQSGRGSGKNAARFADYEAVIEQKTDEIDAALRNQKTFTEANRALSENNAVLRDRAVAAERMFAEQQKAMKARPFKFHFDVANPSSASIQSVALRDTDKELREALTLVIDHFGLREQYEVPAPKPATGLYFSPDATPRVDTKQFLADLRLAKKESDEQIASDEALSRLYDTTATRNGTPADCSNVTPIFGGEPA